MRYSKWKVSYDRPVYSNGFIQCYGLYLRARSLLNESLFLQGFDRFIEVFLHRGELHAKVLERLVGVLVTLLWRIYLVLASVQVSEGLDWSLSSKDAHLIKSLFSVLRSFKS